jgi:hypothetical protein
MKDEKEIYGSFDDLLSSNDVEYDTVVVGDKKFRIGSLTAEDFTSWTDLRDSGPEGKKLAGAILIARSLVDQAGNRIGDENRVQQLRKMRTKATEIFVKKIFKLNGINQRDEEVVKNG